MPRHTRADTTEQAAEVAAEAEEAHDPDSEREWIEIPSDFELTCDLAHVFQLPESKSPPGNLVTSTSVTVATKKGATFSEGAFRLTAKEGRVCIPSLHLVKGDDGRESLVLRGEEEMRPLRPLRHLLLHPPPSPCAPRHLQSHLSLNPLPPLMSSCLISNSTKWRRRLLHSPPKVAAKGPAAQMLR